METPDANERDIDQIIAAVREQIPEVTVDRLQQSPAEDGGIWWFGLPGVIDDVRVENRWGQCPFVIQTEDDRSGYQRHTALTVAEAVQLIAGYLLPLR